MTELSPESQLVLDAAWEPFCIIEDMPSEVRAEIFAQDFLADSQEISVST